MQITDGTLAVACAELSPQEMKATTSGLAARILALLGREVMHSSEIAKRLGVHEQKVYYHTRRMIKAGIIKVDHTTDARGGTAKVLALAAPAFAVRFGKMEPLARTAVYLPEHVAYLHPFITDGRLRARIVVGSPDPHGPEHARSRDANYAIDLGLFLGTYLTTRAAPSVLLDTELRDWNQDLIIIGGPVVNKAADRVNAKCPARYDKELKSFIVAGRNYGSDSTGVIARMPNPYARGKWILYIAGKRHSGTRAAVLAFLTSFDKVCSSPEDDGARVTVVEGVDADSDGIVDDVKFMVIR
jgi:DNA-binding CsgD family transcriptional regulator